MAIDQSKVKTDGRKTVHGKKNGEVFTPFNIVEDMLDLLDRILPKLTEDELSRDPYYKEYKGRAGDNIIEYRDIHNNPKAILQRRLRKFVGNSDKPTDNFWYNSYRNNTPDGKTIELYLKRTISETYFEPACGNGNILIAILLRKMILVDILCPLMESLDSEYFKAQRVLWMIKAVSSIYGVDINPGNVVEARRRIIDCIFADKIQVYDTTGFIEIDTASYDDIDIDEKVKVREIVKKIVDNNIMYGNTLNKINSIGIPDLKNKINKYKTDEELDILSSIMDQESEAVKNGGEKKVRDNTVDTVNVINEYSLEYKQMRLYITLRPWIIQEINHDFIHYEPMELELAPAKEFGLQDYMEYELDLNTDDEFEEDFEF